MIGSKKLTRCLQSLSEVSYQFSDGFRTALTEAQLKTIYDYQVAFGVRLVWIDAYPDATKFGATALGTCCGETEEQKFTFTNFSSFSTAGLKSGQSVSTLRLWHTPATISNAATTWEIAQFDPAATFASKSTAAVVNKFPHGNGYREQIVFFISWATDWNPTSNYLQHAWIHFLTRGLYLGFRRIYFSTQIDDVHLATEVYYPVGTTVRTTAEDLQFHADWSKNLNTKLPAGSNYIIELAHNGNGNIEEGYKNDKTNCKENQIINYEERPDTELEFKKPIGSGTNLWPNTPTSFGSTLTCMKKDGLYNWLSNTANRDSYAHLSHTYSHSALNNATYSDVNKELSFNVAWLKAAGFWNAAHFSENGLIPPAITGLHNGDAIQAWMANGIKHVVGDNTRKPLMNQQNSFWPLTSNVADNGYAGLEIMPRWATTIYYNCHSLTCTYNEWVATSAGTGGTANLLADAKAVNIRHLLGLHHDPFMFHQANMKTDVAELNTGGKKQSLLTLWTETVIFELIRLVDWPVITLKHDDIAKKFISRRTRDQCNPSFSYNYGPDGKSIVGGTVSGSACSEAIPVTFPNTPTSTNGGTLEKVRLAFRSIPSLFPVSVLCAINMRSRLPARCVGSLCARRRWCCSARRRRRRIGRGTSVLRLDSFPTATFFSKARMLT